MVARFLAVASLLVITATNGCLDADPGRNPSADWGNTLYVSNATVANLEIRCGCSYEIRLAFEIEGVFARSEHLVLVQAVIVDQRVSAASVREFNLSMPDTIPQLKNLADLNETHLLVRLGFDGYTARGRPNSTAHHVWGVLRTTGVTAMARYASTEEPALDLRAETALALVRPSDFLGDAMAHAAPANVSAPGWLQIVAPLGGDVPSSRGDVSVWRGHSTFAFREASSGLVYVDDDDVSHASAGLPVDAGLHEIRIHTRVPEAHLRLPYAFVITTFSDKPTAYLLA